MRNERHAKRDELARELEIEHQKEKCEHERMLKERKKDERERELKEQCEHELLLKERKREYVNVNAKQVNMKLSLNERPAKRKLSANEKPAKIKF